MMTQELPNSPRNHLVALTTFRNYAPDSAQAKARLVLLALLADGEIDEYERMVLNHPHILETLGISREGFVRVLHELCEDMATLPRNGETFSISRPLLSSLFGAIHEAEDQDELLRVISALIMSDGHISPEEMQFWKSATQAWRRSNSLV